MRLARLPLVVIGPAEAHAVFEPPGRPAARPSARRARRPALSTGPDGLPRQARGDSERAGPYVLGLGAEHETFGLTPK